jgi:hypothetical protein
MVIGATGEAHTKSRRERQNEPRLVLAVVSRL